MIPKKLFLDPARIAKKMVYNFEALPAIYIGTLQVTEFYCLHVLSSLVPGCAVKVPAWISRTVRFKLTATICPTYTMYMKAPSNVAIEYQRQFTIFNGSFEYPSIYRGEPTEELDNAWHRISKGGMWTCAFYELPPDILTLGQNIQSALSA